MGLSRKAWKARLKNKRQEISYSLQFLNNGVIKNSGLFRMAYSGETDITGVDVKNE